MTKLLPQPVSLAFQDEYASTGGHVVGSAPSAAILDVIENERAKIFLLLRAIGFDIVAGQTDTAEERVTLQIIANYFEFKAGLLSLSLLLEFNVGYCYSSCNNLMSASTYSPNRQSLQIIDYSHLISMQSVVAVVSAAAKPVFTVAAKDRHGAKRDGSVPYIDCTIEYYQVTVIYYGQTKSSTSHVFLFINFVYLWFFIWEKQKITTCA